MNMKQILTLIFFLCLIAKINAQNIHCSEEHAKKGYSLYIQSFEKDTFDGNLNFIFILKAMDTIKLGNLLHIQSANPFFSGSAQVNNTLDSLVVGDSIIFNLNVDYNVDSIPFYPLNFDITFTDSTLNTCTNHIENVLAKVYFTPWNTVEVWSLFDFHALKRLWIAPINNPQRIYIDKNTLPISDIVSDTLADTSGLFYTMQIKGLAYAIPFNQPDTFGHDSVEIMDSTSYYSSLFINECGIGRKKFTGRIQNLRIYSWYTPIGSTTQIKVWLKNAKVEFRTNRWPEAIIVKGKTDNDGYVTDMDGNRDFNFSFCAGSGHTFKEVTMQISMCDPNNSNRLRVKDAGSWQDYFVHVTPDIDLGYSTSHPIVSGQFATQLGDWWEYAIPIDNYGLLYTQLGWAKEYTNNEWIGTGKSLNKNLAIKIEEDNWLHDRSDVAHYNPINNTIHLGTNKYMTEGTIFHEFGHYVFTDIYGSWNYFGKHTHFRTWNNVSPSMTMSEGVANAFAAIMDEMTWAILGNVSNERLYHQRPIFRNLDISGFAIERLSAPVLSEHYLASVMLDLWDGVNNYNQYGNASTPELNDNIGINNFDNFEMSFKDLCAVFWNNKGNINNLYDLYNLLINNSGCSNKGYIRRIFQFNSENIQGGLSAANFPQFNTDDISFPHSFSENGYNILKIVPFGNGYRPAKFTLKNHYFGLDRNVSILDNTINNFNLDKYIIMYNGSIVKESQNTQYISDNLNITNGAILEFNTNNSPMFYNDGTILLSGQSLVQPNSILNVDVCDLTKIEADNNGEIIVGGSPERVATVNFSNNSILELNNTSTLTINNNSSLTIEPGATLVIHPGAQIILNGPNAVLHIKGKIILEIDAEFNPIAGANGFGQLIVENHTGEFQIESKGNNKIIIDPITKPTINTQYNLIVIGEKGLHTGETYQISEFRINNANVLIKDNSLITSKAFRFNVFNSNIYGEQNLNSKGLLAFESLCNINNCRFEYLNSAFTYFLLNGIYAQQEIRNSQFIKCKTSINMNGANVKVKNCLFNWFGRYGDIGIRSLSSGGGDVFLDNTFQLPSNPFNNNISKSLQYVGKDAKIYRNIFVDGNVAIDNKDGNLFLECNNFQS